MLPKCFPAFGVRAPSLRFFRFFGVDTGGVLFLGGSRLGLAGLSPVTRWNAKLKGDGKTGGGTAELYRGIFGEDAYWRKRTC